MGKLTLPVLILNKNWIPLSTTTVRRALVLAFSEAARLVNIETYEALDIQDWLKLDADGNDYITTSSQRVRIPEVMILTYYAGLPMKEIVFSRKNLYIRDGGVCQYCGNKLDTSDMTIEHVYPVSKGGKSAWDNCVLACRECNGKKGSQLLPETNLNLQKKPDKPIWSSHLMRTVRRPASWEAFLRDRNR